MGKIKYRKIPGKVAASAALIALLGAGVAALSVDMIADFEGYVPEAYQYPVGIWTKCFGDTADVVPGARYTFDQYLNSLNAAVYAHAGPVLRCVPGPSSRTRSGPLSCRWPTTSGRRAFARHPWPGTPIPGTGSAPARAWLKSTRRPRAKSFRGWRGVGRRNPRCASKGCPTEIGSIRRFANA